VYEYSLRVNYSKTGDPIKGPGCTVLLNVNVKRLEQSECLQYKNFNENVVLN